MGLRKNIVDIINNMRRKNPKLWGVIQFVLLPIKLIFATANYVIFKPLLFVISMIYKITSDPTYLGLIVAPTFTFTYKWVIDHELFVILFPPNGIHSDLEIIRNYIDWVGILYGFLVSMILVRAWDRANIVSRSLAREAKEILILIEIFESLNQKPSTQEAKSKDKIISFLKDYVERTEKLYNSEYMNADQKLEGDKKLFQVRIETKRIFEAKAKYSNVGFEQAFQRIIEAREQRIENAQLRYPVVIWVLLLASSLLWLALFTFMTFATASIGYFFFFCVSFIVGTIIGIILVFNEPTQINWNDLSGSWKKLKLKVSSI